jgi:hypothetical protein
MNHFLELNPAIQLVTPDTTTGAPPPMSAAATLRNES